ncbi:MAG: PrsW family intramembrane metalloprotease [Clostridia bacterium]|nr:PrsW family intramembrane metalloprotease [Clostridia bacterium]
MSDIAVYVAVIPIALLAFYIYQKDNDKEPFSLLGRLILGGVLSCVAVLLVNYFFASFFPLFKGKASDMEVYDLIVYSFICVGIIEETCKWFFLYIFAYNDKEFDTLFDMIVYSVYIALGFALFENFFYVLGYGVQTGLLRAFTAIPLHACCGVFMGVYLGKAKYYEIIKRHRLSFKNKMLAVLLPTVIHGMYDFCAFSNLYVPLIVLITIMLTVSVILINRKNKSDVRIKMKKAKCPKCGLTYRGNSCPRCEIRAMRQKKMKKEKKANNKKTKMLP